MKTKKQHIIATGNQAVAHIAYRTNEVCPIYPITPASEMSELVEEWSAEKQQNIFGNVPTTFEMQSEVGVAGAMHGALQTGSLATTFTASQGLLLMMPNMFKIAGELTPNVIHVATRSIATHALSVFGDHSDTMAVRSTGYAMLGAASVQEAHDFALISQAATLQSHIPFIHFFDGFRTSHETSKIELIPDAVIKLMINSNKVKKHRDRALNPNNPVIRGTSQGSDVFFQHREASNTFYNACPGIVQNTMDTFANLTGRAYKLFEYVGHPEAEHVIISMASSTETIEKTIEHLNNSGEKLGLIKVRLFRPFSTEHLLKSLPKTVRTIAVLDRIKEAGSTGGPLYLDIVESLMQNRKFNRIPTIVGGRYGLSSKEFSPSMVKAVFNNLKKELPINNFTIGINDDVTNLSLDISENIQLDNTMFQALFYQEKCIESDKSFTELNQLIGEQTNTFVQAYTECDYKKSNSRNIAHLRIDSQIIKAPYGIEKANFIACEDSTFLKNDNVLDCLKTRGTLLVNTELNPESFCANLSTEDQQRIIDNKITVYIINAQKLKTTYKVRKYAILGFHAAFLVLKNELVHTYLLNEIYQHINKIDVADFKSTEINSVKVDTQFNNTLLGMLLQNQGNDIPVSMLPPDGTYATNTSQYNSPRMASTLPEWQPDLCTQCGACSMACPQGAIRIKAYDDSFLSGAPSAFKSIKSIEDGWDIDLLNYTIQVHPDQCNSCNNCVDACPAKALSMVDTTKTLKAEKDNWNHFQNIPEFDRTKIDATKVSQQQLQEPLFKYALGEDGCGEALYLKLLSQLFGDRVLVANATGASSIFGGALPTTPWSKNKNGRGPAWSNSLFEDNAEFGLGFRLSLNQQKQQARSLLESLLPQLDFDLVYDILEANQDSDVGINKQRSRIETLKTQLQALNSPNANRLLNIAGSLVKKSVWIVGGDGWAYDIGYGGIDHVIASGENVNILVLDNEVYANTGGQMSKATPFGASAKFAAKGKPKQKKDLGLLAMTYDNVYVASVAIGANQEQTLKAFNEAESFNGPSVIIAYSHSSTHGIDMKQPSQYHKAAVNSGQWLLYRNDPRRDGQGKRSLQLDSEVLSIRIEDYLITEKRFSSLFKKDKKAHALLIQQIQQRVNKRFNKFLSLSTEETYNNEELISKTEIIKA
jgi:pyruvate-ferredoxin/flavodoxin oxidoreductase